MKTYLILLLCTLCAPLFAETIEWKLADGNVVSCRVADGAKAELDLLRPFGQSPKGELWHAGAYAFASVAEGKIAGTFYIVQLDGFIDFGVDSAKRGKLAPVVTVKQIEFCFPAKAGVWHPIKVNASDAQAVCAVRVAP